MKLNETKFFVFIASLIIGVLISINISFSAPAKRVVLNANQYQDAINERVRLYNEISLLENQYFENYIKVEKYSKVNNVNPKVLTDIKNELELNERILGIEDVQGRGIKITLDDADDNFDNSIEEDEVQRWGKIVHNTDVLEVVNSLKVAGAQAISVNGQRFLPNSEVYCWGQFLKINGVKLCAPYEIYAIGDSATLQHYLDDEDGYLNFLRFRGVKTFVKEDIEVKISGYIGNAKFKYAKEAENN